MIKFIGSYWSRNMKIMALLMFKDDKVQLESISCHCYYRAHSTHADLEQLIEPSHYITKIISPLFDHPVLLTT
jgi:hypothetical protein